MRFIGSRFQIGEGVTAAIICFGQTYLELDNSLLFGRQVHREDQTPHNNRLLMPAEPTQQVDAYNMQLNSRIRRRGGGLLGQAPAELRLTRERPLDQDEVSRLQLCFQDAQ